MERKHIIIVEHNNNKQAWGGFKNAAESNGLIYNTLKAKKFPFEYKGYKFIKVKFNKVY